MGSLDGADVVDEETAVDIGAEGLMGGVAESMALSLGLEDEEEDLSFEKADAPNLLAMSSVSSSSGVSMPFDASSSFCCTLSAAGVPNFPAISKSSSATALGGEGLRSRSRSRIGDLLLSLLGDRDRLR